MSGKISGIYVEIKGDASQLKKELKDARQLITEQAHGMSNALANALSPAQIKKSTNGLLYDLNALANASKLTGKEFESLGVDLKQLQRLTGITEQQFQSLQSKMLQTATATAQEKALKGIATAAGLTDAEIRKLAQQMGVGEASLAKLLPPAKAVVVELSQMQKSVNQAAASLSALSKGGGLGAISKPLAELAANSRLSEAELKKLQGRLVSVQSAKAQEQAIRAIGAATGMTAEQMAALGHKMGVSASVMRSLVESARPASAAFSAAQSSVNQLAAALSSLRGGRAALGDVSTSLSVLAAKSGLSGAELTKLQARMLQTSAAQAQERALHDIAQAANLSAEAIKALGHRMGVSAEAINRVAGKGAVDINRLAVATKEVSSASASASSSVTLFSSAARTLFAYLSAQTMFEFARSVLDAGIAMDSLKRSFAAAAGGQAAGEGALSFLREEAERLGQNFYELAPEFKNVMAAARGTAMEGEEVRRMFSAIAAASTALSLSADDTHGVLRALQQMMSKGKIQAEELRGQLGERLPGALNLMAKAMGVSTAELNKMMEDGKLLADVALPALTREIERVYGAAAETAALESARSAVNRLSEEWTDLKTNMFESDTAVAGINMMTEALRGMNQVVTAIRTGRNDYGETRTLFDGLGRGDMTGVAGYNTYRGKVAPVDNLSRIRVADPRITGDQFIAMQNGMGRAAKFAAELTAEVDKGREALTKYIQTAREKAKADYDAAVKYANSSEEQAKALKVYQEAIAAIDKREAGAGMKAVSTAMQRLQEDIAKMSMSAKEFKLYQIDQEFAKIAKEIGAANPLLQRWVELRRQEAEQEDKKKNEEILLDFSDRYRAIVIGDTAFKKEQVDIQAEIFRNAGADEIAVAQWVAQEKSDIVKNERNRQLDELREQQRIWEGALELAMENTYNVGNIEAYFRVHEDLLQGQMAMLAIELQLAETEAERANIMAQMEAISQQIRENKAAAEMDVGALSEIGLQRYRSDTYMDMVDFYKNIWPDAINSTSDAMGQFVANMVDGQAAISDAWDVIRGSIHNAALSIVQDMTSLFMRRGLVEFIGLLTGTSFTGGLTGYPSAPASEFGGFTGGLAQAGTSILSLVASAKGNVFDSPSLSAYSGGVYHTPQMFALARGAGIFAEAGPEAVMPLRRGPDGVLGVKAAGGSDDETKALLRELVTATRAQLGTKVVNAIGKGAIANELSGSEGEQVIFNHIRRNPSAVRRMLGL